MTLSREKIAFLFPGQGSQYPGMGKSLYDQYPEARELFDQANDILGTNIRDTIFNGSEEDLRRTAVTQPAVFITNAAAYRVFESRGLKQGMDCAFAAGHSLGEYSALYSGGVFDFQTGLKLVEYRGKFIQECCDVAPGTMAAMIGFESAQLKELCKESANGGGLCEMVNFNSPGQIVVAGTRQAVGKLLEKVQAVSGTKAIPLSVSGAFHSGLMKAASEKMSQVLDQSQIRNSRVPIVSNWDAQPATNAQDLKQKLVRQIDHPVLWEDSVRRMIAEGVETFVEIGPGVVLSGLTRKIDRKRRSHNIQDSESLKKTLQALGLQSD